MRNQENSESSEQGGFTIVELMVSMSLGLVVIFFIFSIQSRMSTAMRATSQVQEVNQLVSAAQNEVVEQVRRAGAMIPNGFRTAAMGDLTRVYSPIAVSNNPDGLGPDAIRIYYGDGSRKSILSPGGMESPGVPMQGVDVVNASVFSVGDVVVLTNPSILQPPGGVGSGPNLIHYDACIVEVTAINGNRLLFSASSPYNTTSNLQCETLQTLSIDGETIVYAFIARSYRLDPLRYFNGVLEVSPSGGLIPDDWNALAMNITTMQFATRFLEQTDTATDLDGDGDTTKDWYSSDAQNIPDTMGIRPVGTPIQVTVSMEARSSRVVGGAGSRFTGDFIDPGNVSHNMFGDHDSVSLPGAIPYNDDYIIRWVTNTIDLRNMGVGQ